MTTKKPTKLQEMTDLLKRTQANFENYRKQTELRISEIQKMAAKDIILQILPITDNFELALKNKCTNQEDFCKGIELIYAQLLNTLTDAGIEEINTEKFDPFYHEALMKVSSDKPENTIIEVFQKGFTLNGKVIRHTKVKLSAGKKTNNSEEE